MLLVQADTINGVYEITDHFDKKTNIMDFPDFLKALFALAEGKTIGCAITDKKNVDCLEAEYGITRYKV
jgi:hypothetical protein